MTVKVFFLCPFHLLQEKFVLTDYMPKQTSLNPEMRAILIDWLVEVQVSIGFGLVWKPEAKLQQRLHFMCLL